MKALEEIAVTTFARWSQEDFFAYMSEHFGLDRLMEYGTEPLPDTTIVVNPVWRRKDQEVRRQRALLRRDQVQFGALSSLRESELKAMGAFEQQKAKLLEQIEHRQQKLEKLKAERKQIENKVAFKDLSASDRFDQLRTAKKHFVDTIKLIAYRAETALVHIVREKLPRLDDARVLVRHVFNSTVDLCPDHQAKTLTVRVHPLSTVAHTKILEHLCTELTATKTVYPGTNFQLVFEVVGLIPIPRSQEF